MRAAAIPPARSRPRSAPAPAPASAQMLRGRRLFAGCAAMAACALALAACGGDADDAGPPPPRDAPAAAERLSARVLDDSDTLAMPGDLAVVGEHLVLINDRADSLIRVYHAETGALRLSFGRQGRGPGEFESGWSLDPAPGSRTAFWIYDLNLQRLTHVDLATDFGPSGTYRDRIVTLQGGGAPTSPFWLSDSLFLSPGYYNEPGRLAHFAATGRMLRVVGDPPPGDADVPLAVRQHAYQSTARPNPARTLVAVGTRHADRLDIYRPDGTRVASAPRPAEFEPVYQVARAGGRPTMATGDDLRFGYIDVATTDAYVYALYSGLRRADAPGRANFGRMVRVFDWNAKLVRTFELDGPVRSIAADPADRRLYAARIDPAPAVVTYELGSAMQ
jgi:hypothetical protein